MPKNVRRASIRGSITLVIAQNMMLPRLNSAAPLTEYMTRHGWGTNCMCRRLYRYVPRPAWEVSNKAFDTSRSEPGNTLQRNRQQSKHLTAPILLLIGLHLSGLLIHRTHYSLTLDRHTLPTGKRHVKTSYDTIWDAILTCARKLTWVSLICHTKPTTKKWKTEKRKSKKMDMLHLNPDRFTFLVSAYPGCPGKEAIKRV